MTINSV